MHLKPLLLLSLFELVVFGAVTHSHPKKSTKTTTAVPSTVVVTSVTSTTTIISTTATSVVSSTATTTVTATATPTPAYVACFNDDDNRVLNSDYSSTDDMTVEECAAYCTGYSYFGVEYANQCFCGNQLNSGYSIQPSGTCTYACAGDADETCGGYYLIDIYAVEQNVETN